MDVLIHAGACYSEYYTNGNGAMPAEVNTKGTGSLLQAAYEKGIRNVVYISSSAVLQTNEGGPTDETAPYDEVTKDPYFSSKIEAEKQIFRFHRSHPDMRIVLLLPTVMLGPGDKAPTPTGKFVLNFLQGELKFILPGSMKIVDARDTAKAAVLAISKGKSGQRYLLGGRKQRIEDIIYILAEVSGKPAPAKKISVNKLLFAARMMGLISKITRKPPKLKTDIIKRLQKDFWYDSQKAEKEFGISFRPISETLEETVKWFESGLFKE